MWCFGNNCQRGNAARAAELDSKDQFSKSTPRAASTDLHWLPVSQVEASRNTQSQSANDHINADILNACAEGEGNERNNDAGQDTTIVMLWLCLSWKAKTCYPRSWTSWRSNSLLLPHTQLTCGPLKTKLSLSVQTIQQVHCLFNNTA